MKTISHKHVVLLLSALLVLPSVSLACIWDYDTLKQERERFPGIIELITGKFLRHSPEFYEWRIQDRLIKLKNDPNNLEWHDDLAVAYQKTGKTDKAIELMLAKEKIKPGVYETYSNLGTFYILNGEFEKGLPYIDKALAINPNAHFGREKYQKWLVEYALKHKGFPMQKERPSSHDRRDNFRSFLATKLNKEPFLLTKEDLGDATKAIAGMMRFANHDNPLLLEALGDLLETGEASPQIDAKQIAARAYLMASYRMKDEGAKDKYRKLAQQALEIQTLEEVPNSGPNAIDKVETQFMSEIEEAKQWYSKLRQKELDWIAAGVDVDAEFDKLYAAEDSAGVENQPTSKIQWLVIGGILVVVVGIGGAFLMKLVA